jgi:GntR family transcriptional repressor for pyruvate dehydrogenase complex
VQFDRVKRTRLYEEIAEQIRERIASGQLRPGERLPPERELAAQFGVSRALVRQALTVLQTVGIIESRIGNGTYVQRPPSWSVAPLGARLATERELLTHPLEVRRILEPPMARLAAERASAQDVERLEELVRAQEAKVQRGEVITPEDTAFHGTIARACQNPILAQLVAAVEALLEESRDRSLRAPQGGLRSLIGHRRILEAIRRRDGPAAYDAMLRHLEEVEALILASLRGESNRGVRRRGGDLQGEGEGP